MKTLNIHIPEFILTNSSLLKKEINEDEFEVLCPHTGFGDDLPNLKEVDLHFRNEKGDFFKILSISKESVLVKKEEIIRRYNDRFKEDEIEKFCTYKKGKWVSQIYANLIRVRVLKKNVKVKFDDDDKVNHYIERNGVCVYCGNKTLFPYGLVDKALKEDDFKKVEKIIEKQPFHIDEYKNELIAGAPKNPGTIRNPPPGFIEWSNSTKFLKFESLISKVKKELEREWNKGGYEIFKRIVSNIKEEGKYDSKEQKFLLEIRKYFLKKYLFFVGKKKPQFIAAYDHKLDKTLGGDGSFENINLTCRGCNNNKKACLDHITYSPKRGFNYFEDKMHPEPHYMMQKKFRKNHKSKIIKLKITQC